MKLPERKTVLTWVGRIMMGALFFFAGLSKLTGGPAIDSMFESWGYPADFKYVVGIFESIGGLGLFIPATARYAPILLIIVMTGAIVTHAVNAEYARIITNVVFGLILYLLYRSYESETTVQTSTIAG